MRKKTHLNVMQWHQTMLRQHTVDALDEFSAIAAAESMCFLCFALGLATSTLAPRIAKPLTP
jgi:hypothetical protein